MITTIIILGRVAEVVAGECTYHDDLKSLSRPSEAAALQEVSLLDALLVAIRFGLTHEGMVQQVRPVEALQRVLLKQTCSD